MNSSLKANEKQQISSVPKTADGSVANLDGPVTFVSSDPAVAQIVSINSTEGYHHWIVAKAPGACQVTAAVSQNGTVFSEIVGVTVAANPITDMGIVLGTPVVQ